MMVMVGMMMKVMTVIVLMIVMIGMKLTLFPYNPDFK